MCLRKLGVVFLPGQISIKGRTKRWTIGTILVPFNFCGFWWGIVCFMQYPSKIAEQTVPAIQPYFWMSWNSVFFIFSPQNRREKEFKIFAHSQFSAG